MEQLTIDSQSLSFEQLSHQIALIDNQARGVAVKSINQASTLRNWLIGAYIVEYEQHGKDRAQYGEGLIQRLSKQLADKRLDATLLKVSRKFYLTYPCIKDVVKKSASLSHLLPVMPAQRIEAVDKAMAVLPKSATASHQFGVPADKLVSSLSFSHIRELLALDDNIVRAFYETECIKATWSVRELRRQISSNLHIRIGLSTDKMQPGDNPPVGILLCTHKGKKMVEYALGSLDNKLFVSTYQLQLPDRKVLEEFILGECS